jgi:ribonuclease E
MASHEEARADNTRGLPGASAPHGTTADPDETDRQDETDEQATLQPAAVAADRNGEAAPASSERSPDGAVVSPARPRGVASFPGGPPPTVTPVPDLPVLPVAPQTTPAEDGPRFRVTTVETTAAATRPAGPPPPTPRRAPAPLAPEPEPEPLVAPEAEAQEEATDQVAEAEGDAAAAAEAGPVAEAEAEAEAQPELEVEAAPGAPGAPAAPEVFEAPGPPRASAAPVAPAPALEVEAEAAEATREAEAAEAAEAAGEAEVATPSPEMAAPSPEVAAAEAASAVPAEADAPAEAAAVARPAARRRRRGRSSRSAETAQTPATPEAAERPAAATAAEATTEAPPAPADEALPAGTTDRGPEADDESDEDSLGGASGSARTRARRRRRAAAKARLRGGNQAGPAAEAATPTASARGRASSAAAAQQAPAAQAGGETAATTVQPEAAPAEAAPPSSPRGRRRQRGAPAPAAAPAAPAAAESETAPEQAAPSRTRGRGRRRLPGTRVPADAGARAGGSATTEQAPSRAAPADRSTRLEAARGRGAVRQGDRGRRRRSRGLSEDQKRYLREGLERRMLVTEGVERTQIGVLEGRTLVEHYVTRKAGRSLVGNIYLGRVQNVLPGMEAAFIDIGRGRNAVLYAGEVNYSEEDLDGEAPRIEKALKPGQAILVQVTKDPIGAKGARLTTQVSLAGRYLVLQPEDSTFGISRRLPEEERVRLREILKEVRPKGLGLIVRTAAEGAGADDLRADLARLQARWEAIERKAKKASPPAVIYQEPELVVRVIRDIFSPDFVELVVDNPGLYERIRAYLEEVAPDLLPKMHAHDGQLPLFEQYRVSEQIHKALERKVWLPSGGSLVIDQTEAMTVVDVNTGKYVGKSNLEETVVATNLEAAEEIVRQLRLRDIGGIIIIDFIDMLFERNQQAVVERLRAALAKDKTKSQVMEVSSLGLVQMTRKRVSSGLLDSFSETCPACEGRGVVITHEI